MFQLPRVSEVIWVVFTLVLSEGFYGPCYPDYIKVGLNANRPNIAQLFLYLSGLNIMEGILTKNNG